MNVVAAIPTLDPSENIYKVVEGLVNVGFKDILVINDGSNSCCENIFNQLATNYACTILKHDVNKGKGAAIKTAMAYCQKNYPNTIGLLTLDDDGQHLPKDALNCAKALQENPTSLVLGVRNFNDKTVPFKSRFGNKGTTLVFKLACGINIADTQTGLRGIPLKYMDEFLMSHGDRFEYETNMLLDTKKYKINICQVPIQTVYYEQNKATHFRPLIDSLKIYKQVLKFLASAIVSFLVDFSLFSLLTFFLPIPDQTIRIFLATFLARLCSSVVNFIANKNIVFNSNEKTSKTVVKYYILCIVQTATSAFLVNSLTTLFPALVLLIKLAVDLSLFCISYRIQRTYIFNSKSI